MGVKKADLPDLTIKEVKVYVANIGNVRRLNSTETGEIVSIVTNSGIEGNMTIGNRGNPPGFLAYAKRRVLGKSALDVTSITPVPNTGVSAPMERSALPAVFRGLRPEAPPKLVADAARRALFRPLAAPRRGSSRHARGTGQNYMHDAIIDVCLWDILGKAVNRPIYQLLGGTKTRVMAYASSQHLPTVEDYAPDVLKAKAAGIRGYKIHPGGGQSANADRAPATWATWRRSGWSAKPPATISPSVRWQGQPLLGAESRTVTGRVGLHLVRRPHPHRGD